MSELIAPPYAPPAAGPYSPGLVTGDWIFLSGQGGFEDRSGTVWKMTGLCGWSFRDPLRSAVREHVLPQLPPGP